MGSQNVTASCPVCAAPVQDSHRFCPGCGASLDLADSPTGTAPRRVAPPGLSPTPHAGSTSRSLRTPGGAVAAAERFTPGTVLIERYRIVGLLGRGGMGEVYRADDLKLEQPVALKFLPQALEGDAERLERLYREVRMARQVSHPHVCRVWDVGEAQGQHFLSMEFVDGENLASLLRRIGRLPGPKALDIARQVAAGLAAAHEKGLLHRDLKPANVMLDGQGKVRLTDFGLAAVADSVGGEDLRSGTPSYMSPEQLLGREVTVRSDIYSFGLLLYELFTGRRAFEGGSAAELARRHRDERPIDPRMIVPDLDGGVERTILACLEKEPRKRPPSALAVSAMLAGQDPLAAAIAAGETPSPELVAAAGEHEGLRPAVAWSCLAAVVVGTLLLPFLQQPVSLLGRIPVDKSPAALEDRARELIASLGNAGRAVDTAEGLSADEDYLRMVQRDRSPDRWDALRTGDPPVLHFWFRQSPRPIGAFVSSNGRVSAGDPPALVSGMAGVRYDLQGRLLGLYVVPPQRETTPDPARAATQPAGATTAPSTPDWSPLFAQARLELSRFRPVASAWTPPFFSDTRAAWEGTRPGRPEVPVRVEAAGYRGKPVWFEISAPWTRAERDQAFTPTRGQRVSVGLLLAILAVLLVGGALLAKRNLRLGRGDRRGAFRLGSAVFALLMVTWVLLAHHVADPVQEMLLAVKGAGVALVMACMLWLFHLALEPYVRRERPWTIVSWTRLLDGGIGDAVVGRDVLIGMVWGVCLALVEVGVYYASKPFGLPEPMAAPGFLDMLLGLRQQVALVVGQPINAALLGLGLLLLFLVLRLLLRRDIPAGLTLVVVTAGALVAGSSTPLWFSAPAWLLVMGWLVLLLLRFGVVAAIAAIWVDNVLGLTPHSTELESWTAAGTLFVVPVVILAAVLAFRTATGRRRLLRRGSILEPASSHPA